jgi:hypothetical protein
MSGPGGSGSVLVVAILAFSAYFAQGKFSWMAAAAGRVDRLARNLTSLIPKCQRMSRKKGCIYINV